VRTVLVLSPHTDDGELGAGGTIARLVEEEAEVHYVAFSTGTALDREVLAATHILGIPSERVRILRYPTRLFSENRQKILDDMIQMRGEFPPDLVLAPARHTHQDHEVIRAEAIRAFKHSTVLGYEQSWNDVLGFIPECYFKLKPRHVRAKCAAWACYTSQRDRVYDKEVLEGMAAMRGVAVGCRYAEAFEVVRWVV
jgi:LmbE family N-acetylglucosaminyl deacetylase